MSFLLIRLSVFIFGMAFFAPLVSAEQPVPKIVKQRIPMPRPRIENLDSIDIHIPMISWKQGPVVEVFIDGKGPYEFLLDTGASGGIIDSDLAKEIGLTVVGRALVGSPLGGDPQPTSLMKSEHVKIGELTVHDVTWVAMDQGPFFSDPEGPRGVLNIRWFDGVLVTLDFPDTVVSLISGVLPAPDKTRIFQFGGESPLPTIPIDIDGHIISCTLDSGSPGTITLPMAYQDSLNLEEPPVEITKAKTVDTEFTIFGSRLNGVVKIGEYHMENPEIRFSPVHKHGEIGIGVLEHLIVTFDPGNNRVFITTPEE